jgi:MFS family permease
MCGVGLAIGVPALRRLTPPGTLRAARGIPAAILIRGILTFSFFAVDAYVALVLVEVRGQTATQAGVALTAATLAWSVGSWAQARWARRFGPEWFVTTGFSIAVIGLGLFALLLAPTVPVWAALPAFAVAGFGMGLGYAPLSLIVLRDVPAGEQGSASSALSLTDALGTALGTGATGALVAASIRAAGEPSPGLAAGFAVAVAVGIAGIVLTRRLRVPADDHGTPSSRRRGDVLG